MTRTVFATRLAGMITYEIFLSIGILVTGVMEIYVFRKARRRIAELKELTAKLNEVIQPSPVNNREK